MKKVWQGAQEPPLFWVKKKITEGKKAGRASKENWAPPLAQGLDLPLDKVEKSKLVAKTIGKSKVYIGSSVQ